MDSTTFDIDNTPPTIRVTGIRREARGVALLFEVRDDQSGVQRVDYSIDAERWRPIYPNDGIADSRFEQYERPLDNEAQTRSLVVRAMDAMKNVATARGDLPTQRIGNEPSSIGIERSRGSSRSRDAGESAASRRQ
jgi:hypothetical protein